MEIPPSPIQDVVDVDAINLELAFPSLDVITRRILKQMQDTLEKAAAENAAEEAERAAAVQQQQAENVAEAEAQQAEAQRQAEQAKQAVQQRQQQNPSDSSDGINAAQEVARAYGVEAEAPQAAQAAAPAAAAPAPERAASKPPAEVQAAVAAVQQALSKASTAEAGKVHRFKLDVRPPVSNESANAAPAAPAVE